jgi:hypothetical protein
MKKPTKDINLGFFAHPLTVQFSLCRVGVPKVPFWHGEKLAIVSTDSLEVLPRHLMDRVLRQLPAARVIMQRLRPRVPRGITDRLQRLSFGERQFDERLPESLGSRRPAAAFAGMARRLRSLAGLE